MGVLKNTNFMNKLKALLVKIEQLIKPFKFKNGFIVFYLTLKITIEEH